MCILEWWRVVGPSQLIAPVMAPGFYLPILLVVASSLSPCLAMGDSDSSESHKKVVIHVPSHEKIIKHTHTVYKIIGGGKGKEDNDHKHHGEVIHKHIHGGHVDHVHKHDGHGSHDHKHHGHAEHGHTHHGHNEHKHAHALHGVHDHKHSGHAEHGHKHTGSAQHGHQHGGSFQGSHKHTGHGDHDHKHYGHHDHKHGHHVHDHDSHSRAFHGLLPGVQRQQQGYETYEFLEDLPPRGLQAYYTAANLNDLRAFSRTGRAAAQIPANIAHLDLDPATNQYDVQALFSEYNPHTLRFRKNPFPYNSELYSRYFRHNQ